MGFGKICAVYIRAKTLLELLKNLMRRLENDLSPARATNVRDVREFSREENGLNLKRSIALSANKNGIKSVSYSIRSEP